MDDAGIPFTCFFCTRDDPELSDVKRVLTTIAYGFAQYYADYRGAVADLMQSPSGRAVATGNARKQSELLFGKSLEKLSPEGALRPRSHVLVIDALDECGTPSERRELVKQLFEMAKFVPWIKILVTSRPEPDR